MRIIISFIFMVLGIMASHATMHTYSDQSVLASGKWAKVRVKETGLCRISYQELKSMGFSDPSKVSVFGYGGALLSESFLQPKIDDLPELAAYDDGSALYFYAQGPVKWTGRTSPKVSYACEINHYSDAGYYFLTDGGTARRVKTEGEYVERDSIPLLREGYHVVVINKEEFNFTRSGRVWFGDVLYSDRFKNYAFDIPNIVVGSKMSIGIACAGVSGSVTKAKFSCGETEGILTFDKTTARTKASERHMELLVDSATEIPRLKLEYIGSKSSDYMALNHIVVNARVALRLDRGFMMIRNIDSMLAMTGKNLVSFSLQNATPATQVWNVTDPLNVEGIPVNFSGDSLLFNVEQNTIQEYLAFDPSKPHFVEAEYVGAVKNQNLHSLKGITFVIISHPDFKEEAERLAEVHRKRDDVGVAVVTPEEIYNEFSSGTPDATAYRWLMKMMYDREGGRKYLLLFGDGCFDNKGILATKSNPSTAFLLTYQSRTSIDDAASFTTDDYFGFLDDEEGGFGHYAYANAKLDIGIGRLPVSSAEQAKGVVDKIINYIETPRYGPWKNRVCLVADDNESASSITKFFGFSEVIEDMIYRKNPSMEVKKYYFDSYFRVVGSNGARYPELQKDLASAIDEGFAFLNYVGHSSKTTWSAEKVFSQSQAASLHNKNLGFWFTASCEFSQFDDLTPSGGEDLILNPNGGAIGVYSSTRVVFDLQNDRLNRGLAPYLFDRDEDGRPYRMGDMVRLSKQNIPNDSNKLAFVFLGDPMLRMNYPELMVSTDSLQNYEGNPIDTMKALSSVKLFGSIMDVDSNKVTTFNGKAHILVYDKEQKFYTRANLFTVDSLIRENRFAYTSRPNLLYSGTAEVRDGKFSVQFRVPKDINYSFGKGRISYYAYDDENGFEAQGVHEAFYVGGTDSVEIEDLQGPEVDLFMNNELADNTITVHERPTFTAYVQDANGINATGAGIGHDITLVLNDSKTVTVLNSNFSYEEGSDHSGHVRYQLPELEDGHYTLTFKVWDLLNNSTTRRMEFDVKSGLRINMESLAFYPNPVQDKLMVRVQHNRPSEQITFRMSVYDLTGCELYRSEEANDVNDGTLEFGWDLRLSNGGRLQAGTYVCKVGVSSSDAGYAEKTQNLIVLPQ